LLILHFSLCNLPAITPNICCYHCYYYYCHYYYYYYYSYSYYYYYLYSNNVGRRGLFTLPSFPSRTHYCGDLREGDVAKTVTVCGWALRTRRVSDSLIFLPLRDRSGVIQLVLSNDGFAPFLLKPPPLTLHYCARIS